MDYLISKNILQQKHGNYGDQLVVTGKFGNGRGKQRYINDNIYSQLLRLKQLDKIALEDSSSVS